MTFEDEVVIAYVDGELDAAVARRLERAAAADPALARRIAAHQAVKVGLAEAFAPALQEAAPDRLVSLITRAAPPSRPAEVVDLSKVRKARAAAGGRWSTAVSQLKDQPPRTWGGLAAVLLLGAFAVSAFWPRTPPLLVERGGALDAGPGLAAALDAQLADPNASGLTVRAGLSFRDHAGDYCRTFQARQDGGVAGLACKTGGQWRLRMTLAHPEAPASQYRMAGSDTPPELMTLVSGLIEGAPLDRAGEEAAVRTRWANAKPNPAKAR
jgi:hypothetical protein